TVVTSAAGLVGCRDDLSTRRWPRAMHAVSERHHPPPLFVLVGRVVTIARRRALESRDPLPHVRSHFQRHPLHLLSLIVHGVHGFKSLRSLSAGSYGGEGRVRGGRPPRASESVEGPE